MTARDAIDIGILAGLIGSGVGVAWWVSDSGDAPAPQCGYAHTEYRRGDDGRYRPVVFERVDYRCTGALP